MWSAPSSASDPPCTLHANSSVEVFNRIALPAAQEPERLGPTVLAALHLYGLLND